MVGVGFRVGALCLASALYLAGAAPAQDGMPPLVASEAPVLGNVQAEGETAPVLPGTGDLAQTLGEAASVAVETDLVSLVARAHPVV